jgi:hypothetical protein
MLPRLRPVTAPPTPSKLSKKPPITPPKDTDDDVGEQPLRSVGTHDDARQPTGDRTDDDPDEHTDKAESHV